MLIDGQINLIKFIESNKLDNYTAKSDTFLFGQISLIKFCKIGRVLFHQINLMKKSQSKLKSPRVKKKNYKKIKLQMNEHEISIHVNNN